MNYQALRPAEIVAISPHPVLRAKLRTREVLGWLAVYVGQNTSLECWPSVAELVDESGLSRGTIFQALADLEEAGLIIDTGRKAGRRGQIVVRKLVLEALIPVRESRTRPGVSDVKGPTRPGVDHLPVRESDVYPSGSRPLTRPGVSDTDPLKDPSIGSPHRIPSPLPPGIDRQAGEGNQGEGEFFDRIRLTASKVVDRYLEDEQRPFDQTLAKQTRAKLEAAIVERLAGPTDKASLKARAQDIVRAWELLRDDAWWAGQPEARRRACVRLGWLVAQPGRIEDRFERAGESPQWEPEETEEEQ